MLYLLKSTIYKDIKFAVYGDFSALFKFEHKFSFCSNRIVNMAHVIPKASIRNSINKDATPT